MIICNFKLVLFYDTLAIFIIGFEIREALIKYAIVGLIQIFVL